MGRAIQSYRVINVAVALEGQGVDGERERVGGGGGGEF